MMQDINHDLYFMSVDAWSIFNNCY